jgi:hypothetical protein
MQEEEADFPEVPLMEFSLERLRMADQVSIGSTIRIWDLELRQRTPDLPGIRTFLNERYRNDRDDVEHEDPFRAQ